MDKYGAGKGRPDNTDESVEEVYQALQYYLPQVAEAIRGQYGPEGKAQLAAAQTEAPAYGELMSQLVDTIGRKLAGTGRELSREEQIAAAETEADIAAGPGQRQAAAVDAAGKILDPEFYKQRESLSTNLDQAMKTFGDPSTLSPTEVAQTERALGRSAWNVGSPTQTWVNASAFGDQAKARRAEFNNLINLKAAALPATRTGINPAGVTSNRTTMPNFGLQNFTGITAPGAASAQQLGQGMLGNIFGTDANRQKVYTAFMEGKGIGQGTASAIGTAAMVAGAFCWVAREVYGEDNPKWKVFRKWIMFEAPAWLKDLYITAGPSFAAFIKTKPTLKSIVRKLMDLVVTPRI